MSLRIVLAAAFVAIASLATAGPRGTVPKSSPDRYATHAESDGTKVGATLLSSDEVRKAFVYDVSRSCLVVEVALYPQKDKNQEISLDDFSLRVAGAETAVRPTSANAVAAKLQQQVNSQPDVGLETSAGVGYESGTRIDPVTGQPVKTHGVYTESGAGVGAGSGAPHSGATDRDRAITEAELTDKALPEGTASSPLAGYIYFPMVSKKKHATLQLEYVLNGKQVILHFPEK
jgi:hypothetical protein